MKFSGWLPVGSVAPYRTKFDISKFRFIYTRFLTYLQIIHPQPQSSAQLSAQPSAQPSVTMAPTTQNNSAKNKTPAATQQAPSCTQRQPGCAKGAQGYSTPDCVELVKAVRYFLTLGSQEWAKVQERYNTVYASKNNRAIHEPDSIQNKFRALVNQFKPTGNPNCDPHSRDAKETQKLIDNCASVLALNNQDIEDEECVFSLFSLGSYWSDVWCFLAMVLELQWQCL